MTDGQLRSKRDEFWDTAPAFEGRKEIWDALKAAAQAFESNDHELAQAIIDGASITLPHGKRRTSQMHMCFSCIRMVLLKSSSRFSENSFSFFSFNFSVSFPSSPLLFLCAWGGGIQFEISLVLVYSSCTPFFWDVLFRA